MKPMGDARDLLDRAAARLELRPHGWERMLELAHRRQRRRRLFAGALALVLSATSGAGLWAAFHATTQTVGGVSNREAVARLDRAISSVDTTRRTVRSELRRDAESLAATEALVSQLQGQLATIDGEAQRARVQAQIRSKSARVAELRAHIRQLQDELSGATGRLASLKVRRAELSFPPSIYPSAASFPARGIPGGCPSLAGVEPPVPEGAQGLHGWSGPKAAILPRLSRLGAESIDTDLALADRAYWPVLRMRWAGEGGPGPVRGPTTQEVTSSPADRSPYAGLVRRNCGQRTLDLSWWVSECSVGTAPCAPALLEHFLLVDRRGIWLVWFAYP
jgi:hypothetical protein